MKVLKEDNYGRTGLELFCFNSCGCAVSDNRAKSVRFHDVNMLKSIQIPSGPFI